MFTYVFTKGKYAECVLYFSMVTFYKLIFNFVCENSLLMFV